MFPWGDATANINVKFSVEIFFYDYIYLIYFFRLKKDNFRIILCHSIFFNY